jgi:hypothetical protein
MTVDENTGCFERILIAKPFHNQIAEFHGIVFRLLAAHAAGNGDVSIKEMSMGGPETFDGLPGLSENGGELRVGVGDCLNLRKSLVKSQMGQHAGGWRGGVIEGMSLKVCQRHFARLQFVKSMVSRTNGQCLSGSVQNTETAYVEQDQLVIQEGLTGLAGVVFESIGHGGATLGEE